MFYPIVTEQDKQLPFYLTGIGTQEDQEDISRPNGWRHAQLSIITNGSGSFNCGGETFPLSRGCCFLFEAGVPHSYCADEHPLTNHWITWNGTAGNMLCRLFAQNGYNLFHPGSLHPVLSDYRQIEACAALNPYNAAAVSARLYDLITSLHCQLNRLSPERTLQNRLIPAILFMEQHYGEDISLDELAGQTGLSRYTFCHLFREAYGTTAITYLTRLRLQKAKSLLIGQRDLSIRQIALRCGFRDFSYFGFVFKKNEGITPLQFRNQ